MYESNADRILQEDKQKQSQLEAERANQITNLMDRNLSHDEYINFSKSEDEYYNNRMEVEQREVTGPLNPSAYNLDQQHAMFQEMESNPDANYGGTFDMNVRLDRKTNYQDMKKIMHDYAHIDSAEQAVADWVNVKKANWRNPEMISEADALKEARERGAGDLKFDRPVARGELEYSIQKALHKKDLQRQLAEYSATGDYTKLQQLLLMGSSISGGIGAAETGLMIGISLLGGQLVAGTTAKVGQTLGKTSSIARGVALAQRMALAERLAKTYSAAGSEITAAANAVESIGMRLKSADAATKAAYDTYRAGKMIQGTRGNLANVSAYFGMDGLVTDLPHELAKYHGDQVTHTGEYDTKKVLANLMLATGVGAASPVAGLAVKKIPGATSKLYEIATKSISEKKMAKVQEATMRAHEAFAEEAEKNGKTLQEATDEVFRIVRENNTVSPEFQAAVNSVAHENLSEEEMQTLIFNLVDAIKNGKSLDVVNQLPFRNKYYSNISGMLDTMTEAAENNISHQEFFDILKAAKIPVEMKSTVPEMTTSLAEGFARFKAGLYDAGVKIAAEGGALGRTFAHGFNTEDAQRFLFNTYLSRMADTTEVGLKAGIEAENYINKMGQIKKQVDEIISTYETIRNANDAARKAKRRMVYSYKEGQQNIYLLSDGSSGSLQSALEDLSLLMLPEAKAAEYQEAKEIIAQSVRDELEKGHASLSQADLQKYKDVIQEVDDYTSEFVNHLASWRNGNPDARGKVYQYFNLNALLDGSKEQTGFLKKLSDDLDGMIQENVNLYNSDRIFEQNMKDPQDLLTMLEGKQDIPELGFSYDRSTTTALDMQKLIRSEEATMGRLNAAKAELARFDGTKTQEDVKRVMEIIDTKFGRNERRIKGYYFELTDGIKACENIIQGNFNEFRNTFIENLQTNKFFQKMSEKGMADFNPQSLSRIIREEGQIFKKTLKESLNAMLTDKIPQGLFGKHFDEALDIAVENFCDVLRKDPEQGMKSLVGQHAFNKDVNTAEEIAQEIIELDAQKQMFDTLLQPLIKEIGIATADLQARLFHSQARTMSVWEKCMKNPGKMSELILGDVTMTYMPTFGASESIENLSGFAVEYGRFMKALDSMDEAGQGVDSLRDFAFNPNNMPVIREAILDRYAMLNGLMTESERLQFKENTREGRVAMAYLDNLAEMQGKLYGVGSGKQNLAKFFNPSKLSNAMYYLKENKLTGKIAGAISDIQQSVDSKISDEMKRYFDSFLPESTSKEDLAKSNLALHWFENLDLDKHFNENGFIKVSLNELRDAILEGTIPGQGSGVQRMIAKHGQKRVEKAIKRISQGFFGEHGKSLGLINSIQAGSKSPSAEITSHASKYLEDLKDRLHYKSLEAFKTDTKYFGFDNMKEWYESDMGAAKKAYAVLTKAGSEPFQFYENLKDMARVYANDIAPLEHGMKNAKLLQESVNSSTWETSLRFAVNSVCGTYSQAASQGARWTKVLTRFLSAPMLMKAGLKSLTDYGYQFQYLVTMGLASGADAGARARVYGKFFRALAGDKKLGQQMYISQGLKTDTLQNMLYNTNGLQNVEGGLNEFAPALLKAEAASKGFTDFMLNKMAWIGPLTDYNRDNAAMSLMQAIGEFAPTRFKDMPDRLRSSLGRYGITDFEWDNIYSKDAIMNANNYIKRFQPNAEASSLHDYDMFYPDLLADLTDERLTSLMTEQGMTVSPETISLYRNNLIDKAAMLVNASADEMTSIPSARIQGLMFLGNDPNSWRGVALGNLTQFQSFGAAVNYYQWGRRFAAHMNPDDPLFNKFFMSISGWGSTATDMAGFVSEMAIMQYFINEGVSAVAGNRRSIRNDVGEFQGDAFSEKAIKAVNDQMGLASPLLDAILTGITQPRGQGGGIALSVFPALSNVSGKMGRVVSAATRESTEQNRGQAIAGALIQDIADFTGVTNQPLTQAAWGLIIGDELMKWQMGTNYDNWLMQRRHRGYGPSWLKSGIDYFTNR